MNRKLWLILALMLCGHFTLNLLLPWAMSFGPDTLLVWPLIGITVAQVNLIALWAVFAPGGIGWRWPWAMLMAGGMWYALVLGNRWNSQWMKAGEAVQLGAILLLGLLLAQLPLWVASRVWKYRLYPPRLIDPGQPLQTQYNLRDMLVGMGMLSVLLAAARWIMPPGEWWKARWDSELFVILGLVSTVNLIITLPAMWIVFLRRPAHARAAIVGMIPYSIVVTVIEFSILVAALGNGGDNGVGLYLLNLGQFLTVSITLGILRWQGFRWLTLAQWHDEQVVAKAVPLLANEMDLASDDSPRKDS